MKNHPSLRGKRLIAIQYVYARFGIQLPHPSGMQVTVGH